MFIIHYDSKFINCSNKCFDKLLYTTKTLFKIYSRSILESDLIEALYFDDTIFYSTKILFNSRKPMKDLHKNYCHLAKLIFMFYTETIYPVELDSVISSMCIGDIPLDLVYEEFY